MPDQAARQQKVKPATVSHWEEATAFSKYKIVSAPYLHTFMRARPYHGRIRGTIRDLRDLVAHLLIVPIILRNRDADLILVRYFTTKILLLSAIGLWVFRKKLLFIVQNNMQLAHAGSREGVYFKLLCRLDFQFAFWISAPAPISSRRSLGASSRSRPTRSASALVVQLVPP